MRGENEGAPAVAADHGAQADCKHDGIQEHNTTSADGLKPDLSEAERFLTLLDEETDKFRYRVIRPDRKARNYDGAFRDVAADLERENLAGAGVYVVVNVGGHDDASIKRIRSAFADLDGAPLEPVTQCALEPHWIVQTSEGKFHPYWLVDGLDVSEFAGVQRSIAQRFDSDPSVTNTSRVMRLPGFYHMKGEPFLVRIVHESGGLPYSSDAIREEFPPVANAGTSRSKRQLEIETTDPVLAALTVRSRRPDGGYNIACPFEHEHTDHTSESETVYWPPHTGGYKTGNIKCMHAHCAHRTMDEYREALGVPRQGQAGADEFLSTTAQKLASTIQDALCTELHIDPEASPETVRSLGINAAAIDRMLNRSFWSGSKSKMFILNDAHGVNQYTEKDAWGFLSRSCGAVADRDAVYNRALAIQPETLSPDRQKKEAARIASIPRNVIMDELKWRNQRDHTQWRVDMFTDTPRLELREDAARITLPHVPFPDHGEPDPDIIADYKAHFPELDDVILMITAARFAGDRKKAYLWLLASSDWGKGFFSACLAELGLVVEMSVKEIERVFEGLPAGKRPEEFKRSWVLTVNEFKSVKAEIKQLESTMQIAPKNQLTSEVELFAKMFLSAENVASLVTDHGVEDQFVQRFSLVDKRGSIDDRPLFNQDTGAYRRAVVAYLAREINRQVSEYQRMGRDEADRQATAALRLFHHAHGLGNFAARFSDSMAEVADEFKAWLRTTSELSPNKTRCGTQQRLYLRNATRELEDFLHQTKPSDQVATIKRRKDDIFRYVSEDGRGYASHRIDGAPLKAVRLE